MKKFMTGIAVAALCLSMSMVAFAANPSTTAATAAADGYTATITAEPAEITAAATTENLTKAAAAAGIEDATVSATPALTVEISATTAVANADGTYDVTMTSAALADGKQYVFVHLMDNGQIETGVTSVVKGGAVSFTLTGLSPVSFFEITASDTAVTGASPKTADNGAAVAMILVLAAGASLALISRKKAY